MITERGEAEKNITADFRSWDIKELSFVSSGCTKGGNNEKRSGLLTRNCSRNTELEGIAKCKKIPGGQAMLTFPGKKGASLLREGKVEKVGLGWVVVLWVQTGPSPTLKGRFLRGKGQKTVEIAVGLLPAKRNENQWDG